MKCKLTFGGGFSFAFAIKNEILCKFDELLRFDGSMGL